jgi:hypothetical protein
MVLPLGVRYVTVTTPLDDVERLIAVAPAVTGAGWAGENTLVVVLVCVLVVPVWV